MLMGLDKTCNILRKLKTGDEDGTPIYEEKTVYYSVSCRIDLDSGYGGVQADKVDAYTLRKKSKIIFLPPYDADFVPYEIRDTDIILIDGVRHGIDGVIRGDGLFGERDHFEFPIKEVGEH